MTNGDKIRKMDDEELALFLTDFGRRECKYCDYDPEICDEDFCDCGHRDWIKSGAIK